MFPHLKAGKILGILLTVSMLLYSSESLCLWFWANACLYTPLSLLNNIYIFAFSYLNRCAVLYLSVAKRNAFQFPLAPLFISLLLHHILSVPLPLILLPMWMCPQHRDGERFQRPLMPYILRRPSVANISGLCPGLCCYHLLSGGLDGVTVGYYGYWLG